MAADSFMDEHMGQEGRCPVNDIPPVNTTSTTPQQPPIQPQATQPDNSMAEITSTQGEYAGDKRDNPTVRHAAAGTVTTSTTPTTISTTTSGQAATATVPATDLFIPSILREERKELPSTVSVG
ncbi:hypothetical protein Pmani_008492 [Petrolisthes manimaculis]|uniref:Uncharacterized protein n=1 Tax=Petrolisthes manimaculis TaxID=1843537 RepID=A0AAE1UJI9_9EUCA|nr:hypothetical protein Pmani_008492 [Petrolisthes manimaculis]